jgi:adenine deaminase
MKNVSRATLIDVAMGRSAADFVIKGGILVNVHTAEIYQADIAIRGNRIAFVGEVGHTTKAKTRIIDASGKYILPGFIDTHVHTFHTHTKIDDYARAVMPHGTTTVVNDYYSTGVFLGPRGIKFEVMASKKTPLKVFFSTPMGTGYYQGDPFTNNETLREKAQLEMLDWKETHGINEILPERVADKHAALLKILEMASKKKKIIYGHASGMRGKVLQGWLAGASRIVDHECIEVEEAIEKVRLGVRLALREAGFLSNVDVVKAITDKKIDSRYFMFCSDVASPSMIQKDGHIERNIREAVGYGLDPVTAVQMATINAADYMRIDDEIGSIAPGKIADIVLVDDLSGFKVAAVFAGGEKVAEKGKFVAQTYKIQYPKYFYNTVKLKKVPSAGDFQIKAPKGKATVIVRVIGIVPDSPFTEERRAVLKVENGLVIPEIESGINKIVVFERYRGTGEIGKGFVQGYNMKGGAVASSYHCNQSDLFAIGTNDEDMALAVREILKSRGGLIAVKDGKVLAKLELPIGGVLSEEPLNRMIEKQEKVDAAANSLGSFGVFPFTSMNTPVIPLIHIGEFKICRKGLMKKWKIVPLIVQ